MKVSTTVLCGFFCFFFQQTQGAGWSYEGETGVEHWGDHYEKCAGSHQSPIDVRVRRTVFNERLKDFSIIYTDFSPATATSEATNNGHSLVVTSNSQILVNGGGLSGTYTAAQAHFHWGSASTSGSEHTINKESFPLEMHIVTYNSDKHVLGENGLGDVLASGDPSGLAVLGVFFELSVRNNTHLQPLIEKIPEILSMDGKAEVPGFFVANLLPGSLRSYFRYQGSLTTPTCDEVVVWTLFQQKNYVSEYQLNQLRRLLDTDEHIMQDNWRPTQPLNGRVVSRSFQSPMYTIDDDTLGGDASTLTTSLLPILASLALSYLAH